MEPLENVKSSRVSKTTLLLLLEIEGAFGIVTQSDGGSHKSTATAYLQSYGKDS